MRITLLLTFLLLVSGILFAQKPSGNLNGSNTISGKVMDSATGQPVEYSTITLKDAKTLKPVNGVITDKGGLFGLKNIPAGTYTIEVAFVGYKTVFKRNISVSGENKTTTLDNFLLAKASITLQAVTVTGTRQLIETKIDKLIYNVDKDITSQGGMAADALKKIPGITVDIDGNVELLGNSGIRFLIDGKPSGMFGSNIAEALQAIPASQIQSIEVITSPGAKYDAAGTGGIINIILKKSKIEGFNGNLNVSAGTRLENGTISTSYHKNNFGINFNVSGNAQLKAVAPSGMDRTTKVDPVNGYSRLVQDNNNDYDRHFFKIGSAIDWDLSPKDNITASLAYYDFANNNIGNTLQQLFDYDPSGNELSHTKSQRFSNTKFHVYGIDNSFVYKRKFRRKDQELSIGYDASFEHNHTFYKQAQFYTTVKEPFAGSSSLNPGRENEVNFTLDYAQPLGEDAMLETGLKTTLQSIVSDANVLTFSPASDEYVHDNGQSYTSDYRRQIYSGYLSFNFPLFHFLDIKAGARLEHTISNAAKTAIPSYNNFGPSLVISHSFSNKESIKIAYSYRIERPDYRDLNPFMNLTDPHNITTGNPNLQPEIGNNVELGYNKSFEGGLNFNILAFFQRNSPDIKPYITYYPTYKIGDSTFNDLTITTRANISSEVKLGISISASVPIGKSVTVRTNTQFFNRHLKNIFVVPPIIDVLGFRTNLNTTIQVSKSLIAEAFGNYNLGMHWQGRQASMFSYTFAFRKQIMRNKGSVGLVMVNPFNRYIHQTSVQETQDFVSNNYRYVPYRSFGVSFMVKFGKLTFTKQKEQDNDVNVPPSDNQ